METGNPDHCCFLCYYHNPDGLNEEFNGRTNQVDIDEQKNQVETFVMYLSNQ